MSTVELVGINLETHVCGECGITWSMPERFVDARRENGQTFYCPNGHARVFRESQIDRERKAREKAEHNLRMARERAAAEADLRRDTERRLAAQKGATTRARKRHAAGVCPACHRSFKQLREHMASQHPDYDPSR